MQNQTIGINDGFAWCREKKRSSDLKSVLDETKRKLDEALSAQRKMSKRMGEVGRDCQGVCSCAACCWMTHARARGRGC